MKISSLIGCVGLMSVVGISVVLLENTPVHATPGLGTAFVSQYPFIRETKIDGCATCHMPVKKDFLNTYGLALKESKIDFESIELEDSDGDGTINVEEIKEERPPGSHATFPEYFIFKVDFSNDDPDMGKVHFNHEMHTVKDSFLSKGRCNNCHGKDLFPKEFNDNVSIRQMAHQLCWRCHETSGSKLAPTNCTGCHTGIKEIVEDLKGLLD
jgi:hypothetical protein